VVSGTHQLLAKAGGGFGAVSGCLCVLLQHLGFLLDGTRQADLLLRELSDAGVEFVDLVDRTGDGFQQLRGLDRALDARAGFLAIAGHYVEHGVGAVLQTLDDLLDLGGGGGGLLRQVAHLIGDDRKAAALLAGSGGFDGGVECQQIGLLGDAADDGQYRTDFLGFFLELFHGLDRAHHAVTQVTDAGRQAANMLTCGGGLACGGVGLVGSLLRALRHFLNAAGHGEDVAGDRVGVVLLRLGVFFRALGQLVQLLRNLAQRGGGIDDLADGALQLVEKAVEQLDHRADLVVGFDVDALGQIAIAAGDRLQRRDHAADIDHHTANHQPGAEADQYHQYQAEDDAQPRGAGVGFAGLYQGLLEAVVGLRAEIATQLLCLGQIAGHAIEARSQVIERGAAVDQLGRGGERVVGVVAHGLAPVTQGLVLLALIAQQGRQGLLLRIDLLQHLPGLVEHAGFARSHRIVQQRRYAGELKDHRIGLFQRRIGAVLQKHQP